MNDADQIDSVWQREVEKQNLFESARHAKSTHALKCWLVNNDPPSGIRLRGECVESAVCRFKESLCEFDAGTFRVPNPLGDEITFCYLAS